jgi:hypothetical protein
MTANQPLQATPDCALLFIVAQVSAAPGLTEIASGSVALWKWSLSVAIPVVLH